MKFLLSSISNIHLSLFSIAFLGTFWILRKKKTKHYIFKKRLLIRELNIEAGNQYRELLYFHLWKRRLDFNFLDARHIVRKNEIVVYYHGQNLDDKNVKFAIKFWKKGNILILYFANVKKVSSFLPIKGNRNCMK